MPGKIAFKHNASSAGMDESTAGLKIGRASERGEVKTDEIADVGLSCCQLRVSGCEAEGENVCILSIFVLGQDITKVLACKLPGPFIDLGTNKVLG